MLLSVSALPPKKFIQDVTMGKEETAMRRLQNAEVCTDKSTSETGETTETGDSTEMTKSESPDDKVVSSIRMNNHGLDHLMHGRLQEARQAFMEAHLMHQQASYNPSYDADAREYQNKWVNVKSIVDSISSSDEMKRAINHIFMFGLRIGEDIDDSSDDSDGQEEREKSESIDVLSTTRIDWAITFNLGLVSQFLGIVTTDVWGMTHRADAFDRLT